MEIQLNDEQLQEAVNKRMNDAVAEALAGYSVKQAITERITSSVASGVIGEALEAAVAKIDVTSLTNSLAGELAKATTRAAVHVTVQYAEKGNQNLGRVRVGPMKATLLIIIRSLAVLSHLQISECGAACRICAALGWCGSKVRPGVSP